MRNGFYITQFNRIFSKQPTMDYTDVGKRPIYPFGGSPQASAIICASTSLVTFAGTGGVSRFFLLSVASSSFVQYEDFTVCMVVCEV